MHRYIFICLALACGQLLAKESVKKQASHDVKKKRYDRLGKRIKQQLGKRITLHELKLIAKKQKSKPLVNAILATEKIARYKSLPVKRAKILQTSLYIETALKKHAKQHRYYLSKARTHLPYTLEHDPQTKASFIVVKDKKAFIGEGAFKKVYKAICYDPKSPKIVARAEEKTKSPKEHILTKKLHDSPGIYKTVGFGKHKRHNKQYHTIYSKLYRPGSLHDTLERKKKFSMYEKMKAASEILEGLAAMHAKGIVHRDLGARNYLIEIPKGKPGKRNVRAAISDLGRATYAKDAAGTKVQGNTKYTSPEAIYRKRMKGKDYYKSDIFAVGCVLYWLYHNKMPSWLDRSYIKDVSGSTSHRSHKLRWRVGHATKERRRALLGKGSRKTAKERFELLILRMLHTNPDKRGSSQELSRKMKAIFRSVS